MSDGNVHNLKLNIGPAKLPVYDENGGVLKINNQNVGGYVEVSITVPNIYENMCGWFWNITESFFDVNGEKMWVVLRDGHMSCWDTPFVNREICKVDCKKILKIEEKSFDKLACKITMHGLGITVDGSGELYWAWGDDAKSTKGLWKKAFTTHHFV